MVALADRDNHHQNMPTLLQQDKRAFDSNATVTHVKLKKHATRALSPWAYRAGWRLDMKKDIAKDASWPRQRHVRQCIRRPCSPRRVARHGVGADTPREVERRNWEESVVAKPWGRAPSPWAYRSLYTRRVKPPMTRLLRESELTGPDPAFTRQPVPLKKRRAKSHPLMMLAESITRSGVSLASMHSKEHPFSPKISLQKEYKDRLPELKLQRQVAKVSSPSHEPSALMKSGPEILDPSIYLMPLVQALQNVLIGTGVVLSYLYR